MGDRVLAATLLCTKVTSAPKVAFLRTVVAVFKSVQKGHFLPKLTHRGQQSTSFPKTLDMPPCRPCVEHIHCSAPAVPCRLCRVRAAPVPLADPGQGHRGAFTVGPVALPFRNGT